MPIRALLLPILAGLAGCAATPAQRAADARDLAASEADFARLTAGLVPGKPQACLDRNGTSNVRAYGNALVYRVSKTLVYRSETNGGCSGVARGDVLVTVSSLGRLCAGDIAQTLEPATGMPTGSCGFGPFVAYRRP